MLKINYIRDQYLQNTAKEPFSGNKHAKSFVESGNIIESVKTKNKNILEPTNDE